MHSSWRIWTKFLILILLGTDSAKEASHQSKWQNLEAMKITFFAMKSMKKVVEEMDMKPAIINELNILNSLDHPSIAKINESYEDENCIHAILEFSPGKSFAEMLIDTKGKMDINDVLKIFFQVCKTASYLRKKEVIHRDFKPQNIMICKTDRFKYLDYEVQLIDFGFARFYDWNFHYFRLQYSTLSSPSKTTVCLSNSEENRQRWFLFYTHLQLFEKIGNKKIWVNQNFKICFDYIQNNSYINLGHGNHIRIAWSCSNAVKTHNVNIFHNFFWQLILLLPKL